MSNEHTVAPVDRSLSLERPGEGIRGKLEHAVDRVSDVVAGAGYIAAIVTVELTERARELLHRGEEDV